MASFSSCQHVIGSIAKARQHTNATPDVHTPSQWKSVNEHTHIHTHHTHIHYHTTMSMRQSHAHGDGPIVGGVIAVRVHTHEPAFHHPAASSAHESVNNDPAGCMQEDSTTTFILVGSHQFQPQCRTQHQYPIARHGCLSMHTPWEWALHRLRHATKGDAR